MAYADRRAAIEALERTRGSHVIAYVTADRPSNPPGFFGTWGQIGQPDTHMDAFELRRAMGKQEKLDLLLYTRGGATDAVWPLISLLREFTNHLTVLVPFRAHSAGTLICLGADELILGPMAQLTSVDPTVGNQFNPRDEVNKAQMLGISVEDVISYVELAKDQSKVGIRSDEHIFQVFRLLADRVHPVSIRKRKSSAHSYATVGVKSAATTSQRSRANRQNRGHAYRQALFTHANRESA